MKLLFISQYFYPESFKGNDIVFDLVKRGHEVTVLTAKPNYPNGKFYKGYSFFNKREEVIQGARIIRTPIIPRGNGKGIQLILNYLSFIFFSYFACLFRIRDQFDAIFVQQLSPVTMALPGHWVKKRQKIPLCIWVLDLWPESVTSASKFNNKLILNALNILVKYIYNGADLILISSEFFRNSIKEKIENKNKPIMYFPNWAENIFFKQELSLNNQVLPTLPKGKILMFAGNVGEAQDFESILKAAEITIIEKPDLYWLIVGAGRKLNWIKSEIIKRKLYNVITLGRFPIETMPFLFSKADIMLVTLKDTPALTLTVPAKIQAYMASSKVILGMLNGEGHDLINNAKCGFSVKAGDSNELALKAIFLSNISEDIKTEFENNSLSYYKNNFEKEKLLDKLENDILTLIKNNKVNSFCSF
jgi:glycosyltransferase involved in cell wall biosynthesis